MIANNKFYPLFFLFILCCSFSNSALCEKEKETRQKLELVKKKIQELQVHLKKDRTQLNKTTKRLRDTEKKISHASKAITKTKNNIKKDEKQLIQLKKEEKELQQTIQKQQKFLAKQIKTAYTLGKKEYLKLLLNQQDAQSVSRTLTYYRYFNQARSQQIDDLNTIISNLQNVKDNITKKIVSLKTLKEKQSKEYSKLLSLKKERKQVLKQLAQRIEKKDKKLINLHETEEDLESLLHQMAEALEEIEAIENIEQLAGLKSLQGKMKVPVNGQWIQRFGQRLKQGLKSNGIRIKAKEGLPVKAIYNGRVVFSDWLKGFGLLTIIDHGKGYMSLYANNQSLYKNVGEVVRSGELIATVGQSGGQRSSSLYFEIRYQGKALNPKKWLNN